MDEKPLVLIVDDDEDVSLLLAAWLKATGFAVELLATAEALLDALTRTLPEVICLDLGLPGLSGMDALAVVRERHRTVPVLIITGETAVTRAVEAMQNGAYDYLTKPLDRNKLVATVRNAVSSHLLKRRVEELECVPDGMGFSSIVGRSPVMKRMFHDLSKVAASNITVLIRGESGSGKELVASAIHEHGARHGRPFVAVNCAAIPETLQDSEFFGHEKGAFTGAAASKPGRFEQADGGTLFLDEVAELSLSLQAKLLRVLQERRFERVGGTRQLRSDFRLIAASHRNLRERVSKGLFREDLFYRLAVFELEVPPLRQRTGDVELLVAALLQTLSGPAQPPRVSRTALEALVNHSWPGNVRELRNALERALVLCSDNSIEQCDLPRRLRRGATLTARPAPEVPGLERVADPAPLPATPLTLDELERWAIETQMRATGGNTREVVRILGIGRTTLYRKLKAYRLL